MRTSLRVVLTPALLTAAAFAGVAPPSPHSAARAAAQPAPGTYRLDPPHTFALFAAQHLVVGIVHGRFDKTAGTVVVAKDLADCTVDITIDAASLSTQNTTRDDDLRGPDFFDAAKFPAVTYRGRGVRRSGNGWVIDGTLTIRGVSKVVPLTFTFKGTAPAEAGKPIRIAFQATAAVKRADFNMTRDLLTEIGLQSGKPDVWLQVDSEALAAATPNP